MIKMIGVEDLDELLPRTDILIVDLRTADAYRKYHIKGAKNYPYDDMEQWEKELLAERRLLLYCERGSESSCLWIMQVTGNSPSYTSSPLRR